VGGCHRKRQLYIRRVDQAGIKIEPLLPHFTPARGNLIHFHIKNFIDNEGDYVPDPMVPTDLIKQFTIPTDYIPTLKTELERGWKVFLQWKDKTTVTWDRNNLIGTEHQILMPLAPPKQNFGYSYIQQSDMDLITKNEIVDFKFGKKAYLGKYKWQLGSYRRAALYAQLNKLSPTGDFRLINVFLGNDEPEEQVHDTKKIRDSMSSFETALVETMEQDALIRYDPKYQAPCSVDIYCAFCGWRHCCRGI